MFPRLAVAALLGLLTPVCLAAPAPPQEPIDLRLSAAITVGADGTMQSLEWRNQLPVLKMIAERIEPAVRGWHFEPGRLDGTAAPTQTYLNVVFKGLPAPDGSMKLAFVSADTGAASPTMVVPEYPKRAITQNAAYTADLFAIVDFDAQGVPSLRSYDYYGERRLRDEFVESTRAAVAKWKIELERVGGHPVATSMRIPFRYCIGGCPPLPREEADKGGDSERAVALDSAVKLLDARDPLAGI